MSTTVAENREKARRFIEEAFGEGNLDLIDELVADDFVGRNNAAPEPVRGPEGIKEFASMNRAAYPDLDLTVEEVIAEDHKVVQRFRITGTHEGEFMGIEPTGVEVEVQAIGIFRFEDGQIVEGFGRIDMLGLLQQLGVVEAPGG